MRLDRRVLAVAFGTGTACGVLFGLAPSLANVSAQPARRHRRPEARRRAARATALWLAGVEVTAAFVLTAGALMMLQSFTALTRTDLSFRSENLLTVRLELPQDRYPHAGGARTLWRAGA